MPEAAVPGRAGPISGEDVVLLSLLARGLLVEQIARELVTSPRTVRRRTASVCSALGVRTPVEAVVWAVRNDLV